MDIKNSRVLVTGAAGFIGSAVCKRFLYEGSEVVGIDNINNYYDNNLKKDRLDEIKKVSESTSQSWTFKKFSIEETNLLNECFEETNPQIVINLAAQAGVRYSIKNPSAFLESNIKGFGNILECCVKNKVENLIYASSSSVYGGNKNLPFTENQSVDHPVSLYAATKKSNELMAHVYSHIYKLPTTGLRFFTVYGPWGRPDMSPIIFTKAILLEKEMQLNNFGKIIRDFTYIDDVVESIYRCCQKPAIADKNFNSFNPNPSTSESPYRVFNVGNNNDIEITYFISLLEKNLNKKAKIKYMPLPPGDVIATDSDNKALQEWINYQPQTLIEDGIKKFLKWYEEYYKVQ